MKQRVVYFLKYYVFWLVLMLIEKPVFMLYNLAYMGELSWQDWLLVPIHAFPLDLSVASYITTVFGLLLVASFFVNTRLFARIADVYTGIVLALCLMIFIGDTGVFPYWGFHLDRSIFAFLASPQEVLACAPWWQWLIATLIYVVCWCICFLLYRLLRRGMEELSIQEPPKQRVLYAGCMFVMTGLLFLPIRGSVTTSTMNTGRVYFSDKQALNMSAINPVFNLMESLSGNTFDTQRYTYMPSEEAQEIVSQLLPKHASYFEHVLNTQRPNIVLFILESFSSNAWEAMPRLRQLADEGLFFSNTYASSFRTDRGVVATLSGFPGQPTSSLMTHPAKSQHLPQLGKSLAAEGYRLKFWYGGDEDFTNMRSYLIHGGFMERVNDHSFPVSQRLSKWGAHDHLLFKMASDELCSRISDEPTLDVILSLSSHEPFEVPASQRFENKYLNSVAYTDSCIGAFVDSLRRQATWDRTLLVFVADHGFPHPSIVRNYEPRRYKIPVVWAGGAVNGHHEIFTLCSQIDLVPTLLAQLGIDHSNYVFGKNALDSTSVPFAFYSFNDGFGLLTPTDTVVIDAKADRPVLGHEGIQATRARAFMQRVMEEIERL